MEGLGGLLEALGDLVEASWSQLQVEGTFWRVLEGFLWGPESVLGVSWMRLGRSWGVLEASWRGRVLGASGRL